MKEMELKAMSLGSLMTNCYLAKNKTSGDLLIVDPAACAQRIFQMVEQMKGTPVAILLTHGHFDHIGAVMDLKQMYPDLKVYLHEKEQSLIKNAEANLSAQFDSPQIIKPDVLVRDREELTIAGFCVRVLHTPGHTPGSCCYYLPQEAVLFSGDTLFAGSCGRTDFPGGSSRMMRESLAMLVSELPKETDVFPGHDGFTTIGEEKRYNPFV